MTSFRPKGISQKIQEAGGLSANGELILVVDDEKPVRMTLATMLKVHGYKVLQAASATDALEIVRCGEAKVDLLITDMRMPEIDGLSLIGTLRPLLPGLRIIASTGRPDPNLDEKLIELGVAALLVKPFGRIALLEAVHAALHEPQREYYRHG